LVYMHIVRWWTVLTTLNWMCGIRH
jgi:hypothetical protein